jgi:bile acid-coenzyme A ligase
LVYFLPPGGAGSTYAYRGAEARRTGDGWETLGDLGYLDEDGYLYLTDRETDMIVSGGANVYPAEVEAAIDAFAPVRSSAVIGLPDEDFGQRVYALIDAPEGFADEDLRAFLRNRLAHYKIPRDFERVSEPLRDDAGKVRRSALREARLPR